MKRFEKVDLKGILKPNPKYLYAVFIDRYYKTPYGFKPIYHFHRYRNFNFQ